MTDVQRYETCAIGLNNITIKNAIQKANTGPLVHYSDYAKLAAKCRRYREALEKIKADTHNRPGREPWDYYCNRLHKILMIAMEALGGEDVVKEEGK